MTWMNHHRVYRLTGPSKNKERKLKEKRIVAVLFLCLLCLRRNEILAPNLSTVLNMLSTLFTTHSKPWAAKRVKKEFVDTRSWLPLLHNRLNLNVLHFFMTLANRSSMLSSTIRKVTCCSKINSFVSKLLKHATGQQAPLLDTSKAYFNTHNTFTQTPAKLVQGLACKHNTVCLLLS